MGRPAGTGPLPPLPYARPPGPPLPPPPTRPPPPQRVRPPQVLLGVGAVLVVTSAAAATAAYGGDAARTVLLVLSMLATAASISASDSSLRGTEETLAAAAVALALIGSDLGGSVRPLGVLLAFVLAGFFLLIHLVAPSTVTWPLAAWAATQAGVFRGLAWVEPPLARVAALLVLALLGLGITLFGRPLVARVAFVTTAPWWLAGVALGIGLAWSGEPAERWSAAVLVAVAAAGLLAARLRQPVAPFLGSPLLVPAVSGLVIGTAVAGALSLPGPVALPLAGYAGILLVSVADAYLSGWARGLLRPVTLTAGVTVSVLAVGQLLAAQRWTALGLLCLLAALPLVLVAVRRPEERPETTPAAIGCLAAAVLFALAAGRSSGSGAAVVLTGLYAASLATAALLQRSSRRPTLAVGAACATAAVVLLVALGARPQLAGQLAIQGGLTCAWAWWALSPVPPAGSGTGPAPGRTAWRLGAAQLVLAAWTTAGVLELRVLEAYTLPAAVGLLVAAGPRLTLGPSWPTWGPGLLLAAVPSTAAAVLAPGALRPVLVVTAAAAVMSAGARWGVRAPLLVGAGTAVAVGLGLAALELPLPALGAMAVGLALLLLGASRERRPVAGFGVRLADLR